MPGTPALYQVSRADLVYGLLPFRWWESVTGAGSATSLFTNFEAVEQQYVLHLTGIALEFTGTSGQIPEAWDLETSSTMGTRCLVAGGNPSNVSGAEWRDFRRIDFWLMEGEQLRVRSTWDAGVTTNTMGTSCYGIKIPRGNMQGSRIV